MDAKNVVLEQENAQDSLNNGIQVNEDATFVKQPAMMTDTKNETAISRDKYGGNHAEKDCGKYAARGSDHADSQPKRQKPPPVAPKPKHILSGNSPSTSARCREDISCLEPPSSDGKPKNMPPVVPGVYLFDGQNFTFQGQADFPSPGTIVYGGSDYCIVTGRSNRPEVTSDSESSSDDDIKVTPTMPNLQTLNINIKLDLAHLLKQQTTKPKRSKRYQRSRKKYEDGAHYEIPDRFSRDLGVTCRVSPRQPQGQTRETTRGESFGTPAPDEHTEQAPPLPSKDYLKLGGQGTSDRISADKQNQSVSGPSEEEQVYEIYADNPKEEGGDSGVVKPHNWISVYDEPDFSAYRCYESDTHIKREIHALICRRIDWFVIYPDAETALSKLKKQQNNCFVVVAEDVVQKPLYPFTLYVKVSEGQIIELPVMKVKTSRPPPKYRLLDGKQKKSIYDLVCYYQRQPLPSLNVKLQVQTK